MTGAAAALAVLLVVAAIDVWIYTDARRRSDGGDPVVVTIGPVEIATPTAWLLGCVLLWIFFVPAYMVARGQ